ncbi:MAG TPA: gephyrin-like molybdotransferase Glp, partial [Acidimicrobiales bacterium]|nr:gephyrin-like molybdotransferase Glp [Acidimicrobiales bacterium]
HDVPPFANTAMDGFAVHAADTPGTLTIVGTLPAGAEPTLAVGDGEAIRIMTGAPIPAGADAVVMVEQTSTADDGTTVVIEATAEPGDHVRPAGEDVPAGAEVFPAGTVLGPGHLGVLASVGAVDVAVYRRPRVGVLSTGDELVDDDRPLRPGQIRDANRHTLLALLSQAGYDAVDLGIAPDDESAITAAFEQGLSSCDALITSGGVSVGDFDYVKVVLDKLSGGGDAMRWMQIAIKPAKPLAFGVVDGVPVFGLPGNPVSSMVSFELFARPGLRQMQGHPRPVPPTVAAIAGQDLRRRPDGKLHFVRVVASPPPDGSGGLEVRSSGGQASNLLRSMALANALAVLPDGDGVAEGERVDVLLLP